VIGLNDESALRSVSSRYAILIVGLREIYGHRVEVLELM